ncbi:MAG: hypothetical protein ABJE87_14070 [Roseobacter sp.]
MRPLRTLHRSCAITISEPNGIFASVVIAQVVAEGSSCGLDPAKIALREREAIHRSILKRRYGTTYQKRLG